MARDMSGAGEHIPGTAAGARVLKGLSLLTLGLVAISLLLVHSDSYEPAVSIIPLYLVVCVIVAVAAILLLFPSFQFGEGFCAAFYAVYAALFAAVAFFSGGVSSEAYALFFPLLLAPALHGSWQVGLFAQGAALVAYALAMLPDILDDVEGEDGSALVFYRLAVFALVGVFALAVRKRGASGGGGYALDEDGSMLLRAVDREISRRGKRQVSVMLVDAGPALDDDPDPLLEVVRVRVGEPFLLGEGTVFGVVLSGANETGAEDAARRALATAGSRGGRDARAGVATYPGDASSAGDLLAAAGQALERAYEGESGVVVFAGTPEAPESPPYRAAR